MLVERITRGDVDGRIAASCSSASRPPCSARSGTPAARAAAASDSPDRRISGAPGRKHKVAPARLDRFRQQARHGLLHGRLRPVRDVQGKGAARHLDDRTAVEKDRDVRCVERRRHDDEPEIGSSLPRLARKREAEIRMDAALMKLVDHDRPHIAQQGILLQTSGQYPFGHHQQPCLRGAAAIKSHVPADFPADGPASLARQCVARWPARPLFEAATAGRGHPPRAPVPRASSCPRRPRP